MRSFFTYFFASLLAGLALIVLSFFLLVGIAASAAFSGEGQVTVPQKAVMTIDLGGPWHDRVEEDPFMELFGGGEGDLSATIKALEEAAADSRITCVYLRASGMGPGYTTAYELRAALRKFQESGKPVYVYGTLYDQRSMLVASLADSIFIHPEGMAEWFGISAQIPSYAAMLRKIGVKPEIIRATGNTFKSAVEPFFLDTISAENRLQTENLINQVWQNILATVGSDREIPVAVLDSLASNLSLGSSHDLIRTGLADALMHPDEVLSFLGSKTDEDDIREIPMISAGDYASTLSGGKYTGNKLAVVYAEGEITMGSSGSYTITGTRFVNAIREARLDPKVSAVVVRVNSPGGSSLVSELIAREIDLTAKEKPVVVSMGNVAASGGYYIASSAEKIFVSPTTITGSIGVFGTLFSARELLNEKMGIRYDEVKTNPEAGLLVPDKDVSPAVMAYLQRMVDQTYATFIQRVAEGRNMPLEAVAEHAKGRVWTGMDALSVGLADTLGGLADAMAYAAQLGELPENYRVVALPKVEDPFAQFTNTLKTLPEAFLKQHLGEHGAVINGLKTLNGQDRVLMRMEYDLFLR